MASLKQVFFSYEVGSREIVPFLALAVLLARSGISSIVAHKRDLQITLEKSLSRGQRLSGLYIYKDANREGIKYLSLAKRVGLTTLATDEEALNCYDDIPFMDHIAHSDSRVFTDYFCASSLISSRLAKLRGFNVVELGSLRLGLCKLIANQFKRPQRELKRVLFTSPTGTVFSRIPASKHFEIAQQLDPSASKNLQHILSAIQRDVKVYQTMIPLLAALRLRKHLEITLRPHPGEYHGVLAGIANEFAIPFSDSRHVNSIIEMTTMDGVIGYDCATLIEAYFLGIPLINLSSHREATSFTATANFFSPADDALFQAKSNESALPWQYSLPMEIAEDFDSFFLMGRGLDAWSNLIERIIEGNQANVCAPLELEVSRLDDYQDSKRAGLTRESAAKLLSFLPKLNHSVGIKINSLHPSLWVVSP